MSGQMNLEPTGASSSTVDTAMPAASAAPAAATVPSAPATPAGTPMEHSKYFGPSASHSWLHCPYSAFARNAVPDKSSVYAETGQLAHELCEIKLKLYFNKITSTEFQEQLNRIQADPRYTTDMLSNSETYLQTVKELSLEHYTTEPIAYIEQLVKYEDICGDDGFGTSDCILLGGDTLTVIDYKNGQGVTVSAKNNPQMRLYAYGALHSVLVPGLYDIKKIVMCIVQPNINMISTDVISKDELLSWIDATVKPAVAKIQSGCKDRVPGHWCKDAFCPNYAYCAVWREKFAAVYADYETEYIDKDFDTLTTDELGDLYAKVMEVSAWIKALGIKIQSLLTDKTPVKGWKLVAGRGSGRKFTDVDKAYEELSKATKIDKEMFYFRAPLGITAAGKLVGPKLFDKICGPYLVDPPGKPTVVPESDPRKAIDTSAAAAFADMASPTKENPPTNTKDQGGT